MLPELAGPRPLVSVVIPSFNGKELLRVCLRSLAQAAAIMPTSSIETIVVDDCSSDGTFEWLTREWGQVACVRLAQNRGFAGAANAGIAAARGQWVAILNNDAVVDRNWISVASGHFGDESTGCVASKVVSDRTGATESAGDGYTIAGLAYQRRGRHKPPSGGKSYRTFSACAAAAFYRRRALREVGVFEEPLESYYEDVDLGFRLNLAGWRTICEPKSTVRHLRGASYGERSWRTVRNSARNSEIVYFSCMPRGLLLKSLPAHLVAVVAQGFLRTAQGGLRAFLSGKIAFLAKLPQVLARRRRIQSAALSDSYRDVVELIEQDWFSIHMTARLRRHRNSELRTAAQYPPDPAQADRRATIA